MVTIDTKPAGAADDERTPKKHLCYKITSILISLIMLGATVWFLYHLYQCAKMDRIYEEYHTALYIPPSHTRDAQGSIRDVMQYSLTVKTASPQELIPFLEKALGQGSGRAYYQDASWRLALAYLKTHRQGKAEELLQRIVSEGQSHSSQAEEVLQEL
jgi:hypothetical protein